MPRARRHRPKIQKPTRIMTSTKNPKSKTLQFKKNLSRRVSTSLEGLNSSLAQSAGKVMVLQSSARKVLHAGLNTLASGSFWGFPKKYWNARGFAWEFLQSSKCYGPVRSVKDMASLLVCTWKKILAWGMQFFCEWRHKWRPFRPPWPTLPGPGVPTVRW